MRANDDGIGTAGALRALGAIFAGLVIGWEAQGTDGALVDESAVEIAAEAQTSAAELADSLRSLEGSLQTSQPSVPGSGKLTAADNDALIATAAKAQLTGIADDLDLLSSMLAAGADSEETKALRQSLAERQAILGQLGHRTSQPLMSTAEHQALMQLWAKVQKLNASDSLAATPVTNPGIANPQ